LKQGQTWQIGYFAEASTNPKPFQGLKQSGIRFAAKRARASTNPKPFQGLKPELLSRPMCSSESFNQPKTLSGIETLMSPKASHRLPASTNPKPFQGLKQQVSGSQFWSHPLQPTQNPFRD